MDKMKSSQKLVLFFYFLTIYLIFYDEICYSIVLTIFSLARFLLFCQS